MANVREGFIFYVSFREAIRGLPAEQQLALYNALVDYALYDKEPDFGDGGVAKGFFALMKPQIIANNHKRENGLRGGRPAQSAAQERRKNQSETTEEPTTNQDETKAKPKEKEKVKAKVNAKVKEKVKAKANAKAKEKAYCADAPHLFSKPTVDEIRAYCRERGYAVDPQRFFDFYEAKGWRIGNQPMQDWRAAVRTWEGRDSAAPRGQQVGSTKHGAKPRFAQHDCTDEALSHLLVDLDADPQERVEEG